MQAVSAANKVVLLDACAIQLMQNDDRVYSGGLNDENLVYLTELRYLLDENVFVTPRVSEELQILSRLSESFRLPRRYKAVISYVSGYASHRTLELNQEETAYLKKISGHFEWYSQFISEADCEMLMYALTAANSRGSAGVLTNDIGIVKVFNSISEELENDSCETIGHSGNIRIYTRDMDENKYRFFERTSNGNKLAGKSSF